MRFSHTGLVSISLAAFLLLWPGMTQLVSAQTLTALQAGAESGDPESQYELARAYESGKGVIQDDFEAVRWLRAAAAQDHPTAALDLGWMLANGYGVTKDIDQAYFWFSRAAALGAEGAIDQRDALASALDGSARRVLEQEALSGIDNPVLSAPPSPALAMDSDPILGPEDTFEALRDRLNAGGGLDVLARLRLLAQDGDMRAQNLIGLALRRSTDPSDQAAGFNWLGAAARAGLPAAQYNLASAMMEIAMAERVQGLDHRTVEHLLDAAAIGGKPAAQDDYDAITREFADRTGVTDAYRAAVQGSIGAYPELQQLITSKRQELAAQKEFHRRLGATAAPQSGRIESTFIE